MWLQYDFGDGPVIDGVKTTLFCAWLAWSRFRVVLAIRDKTMPSVFAALDVTLRRLGGAPTYVLTDNEKTVTVEHVAGIAVRNPQMVAFARHYARHGAHLRAGRPGHQGRQRVDGEAGQGRPGAQGHQPARRPTARSPSSRPRARCSARRSTPASIGSPAGHRSRCWPRNRPGCIRFPTHPHTVAFGLTRTVPASMPMVSYDGGQYSVPHTLVGETVWVRVHGRGVEEQVVIVHIGASRAGRGRPTPARHPGQPENCSRSTSRPPQQGRWTDGPRPKNAADAEFLALGEGAHMWLTEAAAAGSTKMRVKMSQALAPGEAVRSRRGRLGTGACRGPRPVRRGRSGIDPGPPRRRPHQR